MESKEIILLREAFPGMIELICFLKLVRMNFLEETIYCSTGHVDRDAYVAI